MKAHWLDDERRSWVESAWAHIDADGLASAVSSIVDLASPTGDERPLAEHLTSELSAAGLEAELQPIGERQANATGRLAGGGNVAGTGGSSLLLYSPIDTVSTGDEAEDVPWIGPELRDDMVPAARREGDLVSGLGAHNPKGHAACVLVAAAALARAGVPLLGDLLVGFGAGGMPTGPRPGQRANVGQGAGCSFLLEQGVHPDQAVIAKSGWSVSWEEVGLAWFEVLVPGTHTYVGSRHLLEYRNAIATAGAVVERLEAWFEAWAERHRSGLVAPQGVVSAIEAGWPRMPAFTPAVCRLVLDLRLSPRTTPAEAQRELRAFLDEVGDELGVALELRPRLAIAGTTTDPDAWVVRSSVRAWEALEGRLHEPATGMSGATDANILRSRGVPTARIGLPKVSETALGTPVDFQRGMNTVSLADMERLARHLVLVAVDTCTRPRSELGMET